MKRTLPFLLTLAVIAFASCAKDDDISKDQPAVAQPSPLDLYINEIVTSGVPDWIEVFNPGAIAVDLAGCRFQSSDQQSVVIAAPALVPAGGFLAIYAGDTAIPGAFNLGRMNGSVKLLDKESRLIDSITYPGLPESVSYGRWPDGSELWSVNNLPSPGTSNDPVANKPPVIENFWITNQTPVNIESVSISAVVRDDRQISHVWIYYDNGVKDTLQEIFGVTCGEGFAVMLPPMPSGTGVSYYLIAEDDAQQRTHYPANAPAWQFRFTVQ